MIFSNTRRTLIESLPRLMELRINLKKDVEQPEVIAGTHLIKLLSDGIIPLEFNNHTIYNEPFYRDIFFDRGWSENIDRIAYFQSRSVKKYRLFPQPFIENEGNQVSFIKAFENMVLTKTEDSNEFERNFLAKENVLILTQTNPELLSQVLLTMLRRRNSVQLVELDDIVDFFLKKCIDQLSFVGVYYFGVNATTNAISIAQLVGKTSALMEIGHILQNQLFSKHPATFTYIMYLYPSLVSKLIITFPDTILEELLFAIDRIPMEKSILSSSLEKSLDYIEMLRRIYEFIDRKEISSRKKTNILHQLVRLVHESVQQEGFSFDRLNVNQLGNLAWFASLVGDKQLMARIDALLHFNTEFSF